MNSKCPLTYCVLAFALAAAAQTTQGTSRPPNILAIGDLVEVTVGMGPQIAEIMGGPDPMGYYFAGITGRGPSPFARAKLKLIERADTPSASGVGLGDVIQFHAGMNTYERGVVSRAVGAWCQVRGNGIAGWVDCKSAKVLQRAANRPPASPTETFSAGESLQVRVGDYWMKGAAAKHDPATNWYAVVYEDGGTRYVGVASPAVLRKGPGLQLTRAAEQPAAQNAPQRMQQQMAPVAAAAPAVRQNPSVCGGQHGCTEVNPFAATLTDFRVTPLGRDRLLTATVRFQNKNAQPLILGFVADAGVALDDQGNRYIVAGESSVRGIGLIVRNTIDPKFVLQPGESSDARFELIWRPARSTDIFGTSFTLDLTLREIVPLAGNQYQLGREHAIRFSHLTGNSPAMTRAQPHMQQPATQQMAAQQPGAQQAADPPAAPPPPAPDACAGKPRCFSTGVFTAEIVGAAGSQAAPGAHHIVRFNVRLRNLTTQPIILAYKSSTNSATDNFGNPYYWGRAGTYDTSVQGIGIIGRTVDASFTLNPGEARNATFAVVRYNPSRNSMLGTGFTFDTVIGLVEVMTNGQQVRVAREYSLNFQNLTLSGPAAAAPSTENVSEAVRKIGDLFKKK